MQRRTSCSWIKFLDNIQPMTRVFTAALWCNTSHSSVLADVFCMKTFECCSRYTDNRNRRLQMDTTTGASHNGSLHILWIHGALLYYMKQILSDNAQNVLKHTM